MRRPLSLLAAAAMLVGSLAVTFTPAEARDHDFYRHHHNSYAFYNHGHHRHGNFFPQFYFGFPFAFAPAYEYQDCYRAWNGRLYCRYY